MRGRAEGAAGPHAAYFEKVLEAERHAESIEEWCPGVFPGLLQTAPYARVLVRSARPTASDERVEEKVPARLARARLFEDDHSTPEYWVVLHESVLTDALLPPIEMAEQLDPVVKLTERYRIVPQIVPRRCGAYPLMAASAKVMTFPDAPPLVHRTTEDSWTLEIVTPAWPNDRVLLSRDGGLPHAGPHGERWWHIFHSSRSEIRAAGFSPSGQTIAVATSSDISLWTRVAARQG
ncbi:DUF5753 domain-containing protein [Streptomyces sp. B3I8]|uniref:DUF5753 domain-containing protein n=1 Tax=Streptomyces sp. B3I8 TaxID=3042303 RepID=UPI002783A18C|nr:DUF5753 domain-containing protein [Streptomyces sp. B3I8]MDQ0788837.1 hypothetical protein [Streptomyces sp. B3I8]